MQVCTCRTHHADTQQGCVSRFLAIQTPWHPAASVDYANEFSDMLTSATVHCTMCSMRLPPMMPWCQNVFCLMTKLRPPCSGITQCSGVLIGVQHQHVLTACSACSLAPRYRCSRSDLRLPRPTATAVQGLRACSCSMPCSWASLPLQHSRAPVNGRGCAAENCFRAV